MMNRRTFTKVAAIAPALGATLFTAGRATAADTIKVGSKDFTEQFILGNMYILVLKDLGLNTEDKTNLGGTAIAQKALVNGDIDLYPEYTGTGLTDVLKISIDSLKAGGATPAAGGAATPMASPAAAGGDLGQLVYDTVKQQYKEKWNLTWLARSPFNDTQSLSVKKDFAEKNSLKTVSDLAKIAGDLTISAPADFPERQDGLLGLQKVYGEGFEKIKVLPVTPGLKYKALLDGQAQVVLSFSTDGQISGYNLQLLEDDKGLWPPYNVAPVVRQPVLDAHADIVAAFDKVTTSLTNEIMSGLNWQVDGDAKKEPKDVAEAYLKEKGFIKG